MPPTGAVVSGAATNSWRHVRHAAAAPSRRPRRRRGRRAPRASRGPPAPPPRRWPRSASTASARATGSCGRKQMPAAKVLRAVGGRRRAVRSRRPRAAVRRAAGCRMPAPSPLFGSAPAAPRCSRCSSATSPSATMACERRPWMSAIMATPQESDSCSGSYRPWAFGQCREQHWRCTSAVRENLVRDCTGPIVECISAAAGLPAEKRRDQREPGQVPHHRPGDARRRR